MSETALNGLTFFGFDETQGGKILFKGPFGNEYAISTDCSQFKLIHGQRVMPRRGPMEGKTGTIVGVHDGSLWIHFDEDNVAISIKGATNSGELEDQIALTGVSMPAGSVVRETGPLGIEYAFHTARLIEVYGVRKDEVVSINGATNVSIVGEMFGCLWVRQGSSIRPLPRAINEKSFQTLYQVGDAFDPNAGGKTPRRTPSTTPRRARPPYTHNPQKQIATCEAAFGNTFEADTSRKVMSNFGVIHGQTITPSEGALRGKMITVVGVHLGSLWVLVEGENRVTCLRNCTNGAELREAYGFGSGGTVRKEEEPAQSPKAPASPRTPRKEAATPRAAPKETPEGGKAKPSAPPKKLFTMWTAFGEQDFDTAVAATQPYGFHHGQTVKCSRGPDAGNLFHVVGVSGGVLWVVAEGKPRAVALRHCQNKEDLLQRYGFVATGKKDLTYLSQMDEPAHTPIQSPRGTTGMTPRESTPRMTTSYASAPAASSPVPGLNFSALSPSPNAVDRSLPVASMSASASPENSSAIQAGSTQRNYLKAVALLKTGCKSASEDPLRFHKYYMASTSLRLSHAMSRYNSFRDIYNQQSDFDRATTDDMLQAMRRKAEHFV